MTEKQMKKKLEELAEKGDKMLIIIDDPVIDTVRGEFVLGPLLRLIAASFCELEG